MRVLFLAPQPFYQERGTPIAVRLLAEELARRGWEIDLLAYHEGAEIACPNLRLLRISDLAWVRNVRPGFSLKKVVCDVFFFLRAVRLARRGRYDYIHAVEESAFMARWIGRFTATPYVYDMDSSIPEQMVAASRATALIAPLLRALETSAIRHAAMVLPVCGALADLARRQGAKRLLLLRDVPLPGGSDGGGEAPELPQGGTPRFLYVGNLEPYQGIDLLLNGFARALRVLTGAALIIVGGAEADVEVYRTRVRRANLAGHVHFLGAAPLSRLQSLTAQADVLVSPRVAGSNTPMKIYSYLQSGKPILATDIPAHREVLAEGAALLVAPEPDQVADGLVRLGSSEELRRDLGARARELSQAKYSREAFDRTVTEFCRLMEAVV
jgi:glycosyltransferase involved in cell wall biosynthesis